ncbi:sulfate transporter family-domain-containing protein [Phascolomyces articulosus]|uniref:Sulfate transporter family-domain-containing protein n=1 Tax=Phascolomyces articulosus TaxID=60185 RepID=A0AAD5KN72_9FUNG|nr:sulfate transporter family-domain-containing protein [Phascolomyces articulosus]
MTTTFIDNPTPNYKDQARSSLRSCPTPGTFFSTVFPIVTWLPKYNLTWLWSDFISGLTIGCIVVPQAMAYAKLVGLPAQYGLYTSFVGVAIYPFVGTSKDINIGTTAIQSLFLGQIFATVQETTQFQSGQWTTEQFAVTMSLFAGIITLFLSIFQLGILFNFICQPAISGFMAGSALTIVISQLGKILGIHVSTKDAPYLIFGNTLKALPEASIDALIGILSLVWLYGVKYACKYLAKRYQRYKTGILYFSMSRNVIVLIFTTFLSWLINHFGHHAESPFTILGPVPPGFQNMGVPKLDKDLIAHVFPNFPSMVVLLIMEHCSIASSLGQSSDYRINVNQEILSVGLANIFGSFFSAYPATGSFCRSAVASKSGSKTPVYNVVVAIIVILALYALTPAFQFIPTASLAAVIAHAVTDLIVGPSVWRRFWNVHPSELLIFACAFIISLFARLDISIYVAVGLSVVVQLYRSSRPRYAVIGRMDDDNTMQMVVANNNHNASAIELEALAQCKYFSFTHPMLGQYVRSIAPGVIAFQPRDNMLFENSQFMTEKLMDEIKHTTRRGKPLAEKIGDRPWSDADAPATSDKRPLLHAVIMDMTCVNQMDYSAIDYLKAVATQAERYSGRPISWFFVLNDSWAVRQCLLFGGFGTQERKKKKNGPFRSDLKKRKEQGDDDVSCTSSEECQTPTSIHGDHNNKSVYDKKEERVVQVEDIHHGRPCKIEPTLSYGPDNNHDDSMGCRATHLGNTHLDDVYPYFFLTMGDAVVAACTHHAVPDEEPISSSSSSASSMNDDTVDEEKKIEKQ